MMEDESTQPSVLDSLNLTDAGKDLLLEQARTLEKNLPAIAQSPERRRITLAQSDCPELDAAVLEIASRHPNELFRVLVYVLGDRQDSFEQKARKVKRFGDKIENRQGITPHTARKSPTRPIERTEVQR